MAIASCLVDTNILLRMTRRSDPQHIVVDTALVRLAGQGSILHYTHQNIAELWNAMTRPVVRNGLGLTVAEAEREVQAIELIARQRSRLQGVAEDRGAVRRVGSSSARRALGSGDVRARCQPHTHHKRDRFQPLQRSHGSASR